MTINSGPANSTPTSLVDQLLQADGLLPSKDAESDAKRATERYVGDLQTCRHSTNADSWRRCALRSLLGSNGMKPTGKPAAPEANTITSALVSGEGSCAALVAAVLALTEPFGEPFDAVVMRDHVVLGLRSSPGIYFEVLEGGRQLTDLDLRRHKMPPDGRPLRVRGQEYLAYYLDNLAARLADTGGTAKAESALLRALVIAPKSGRVHYNYGTLLLRLARNQDALEHLRLAIKFRWDDADAWVNRGVASWKLGRLSAARRSFEKALAKEPGNRQAATDLEALRKDKGP